MVKVSTFRVSGSGTGEMYTRNCQLNLAVNKSMFGIHHLWQTHWNASGLSINSIARGVDGRDSLTEHSSLTHRVEWSRPK